MSVSRAPILGVLLQVIACLEVVASEPIEVLNANGLSKSGRYFVVSGEEQAIQGLTNIAPFADRMGGKWGEWAAIIQNEYEFRQLSDYKVLLVAKINDYDAMIGQMPARNPYERFQKEQVMAERNVWNAELGTTNTQLEFRRQRLVGDVGERRAEDAFKQARDEFLGAKRRIGPQIEETLKRYDEIKTIDSVLNALKQYNIEAHAYLKIGPSESMAKKVKQVLDDERTHSPETAPVPKKVPRHKHLEQKNTRKNLKQGSPGSVPGVATTQSG